MSSGPCRAFIIGKANSMKPFEEVAKIKDEIRKKYGESDMRNVLHSSDSAENMEHEASIFFQV
jgi:nucleoside diphosphate kinase